MNINSLGGPRMTPLTSANSASSPARTSFGSLLQGAGAPKPGAGQLTGGNVISAAININSNPGIPTGVGAPYQQTTPQAPAPAAGGAQPGSEFNGELKTTYDAQKMAMMKQLAVLSITSFASSTFSLGNNRIQLEVAD
ncbi:MAG TPA: hypothetical protein VF815_24970 [Myxococcaceae bacterium]|jgi:hypothetical protein